MPSLLAVFDANATITGVAMGENFSYATTDDGQFIVLEIVEGPTPLPPPTRTPGTVATPSATPEPTATPGMERSVVFVPWCGRGAELP